MDFLFGRAPRLKEQKGATLVEFAVIAPLLFLISFGIIELGILLYDKAMLTNASREGARAGILFRHPALTQEELEILVDGVVQSYCQDHLVSFKTGSTLDIDVNPVIVLGDSGLSVTATYPFRFLFVSNLLAWIGNQDLVNLQAVTVMRRE